MSVTRTTFLRILKISVGILFVLLIGGYALFRSLSYARGPEISVLEPLHGSSISASTTVIRGVIQRAHNVTLNGKPISIDEAGNFSETLIIFPGSNLITLEAEDQFKRSVKTELYLVGKSAVR